MVHQDRAQRQEKAKLIDGLLFIYSACASLQRKKFPNSSALNNFFFFFFPVDRWLVHTLWSNNQSLNPFLLHSLPPFFLSYKKTNGARSYSIISLVPADAPAEVRCEGLLVRVTLLFRSVGIPPPFQDSLPLSCLPVLCGEAKSHLGSSSSSARPPPAPTSRRASRPALGSWPLRSSNPARGFLISCRVEASAADLCRHFAGTLFAQLSFPPFLGAKSCPGVSLPSHPSSAQPRVLLVSRKHPFRHSLGAGCAVIHIHPPHMASCRR